MWLTQICVTAGTVFQSQIWYSTYCDMWNKALMGCPSLSVSLNIKRESPGKALWGPWLTYIEKHTHRCIFIRHIMFVCVNNPVISNCCIISTFVGSHTNTHTHTLTHKKLHSWSAGTQCPSVSARVCVCVFFPPLTGPTSFSLGFRWFSAGFLFPRMLQICWWWPGTCLNKGQPASAPVTHLTVATATSTGSPHCPVIQFSSIWLHSSQYVDYSICYSSQCHILQKSFKYANLLVNIYFFSILKMLKVARNCDTCFSRFFDE